MRQVNREKKEEKNVIEIIRGIFTVKIEMAIGISLQNFPKE